MNHKDLKAYCEMGLVLSKQVVNALKNPNSKGKRKQFVVTAWEKEKADAIDAIVKTPLLNVRNDSVISIVQKEINTIKKFCLLNHSLFTESLFTEIHNLSK